MCQLCAAKNKTMTTGSLLTFSSSRHGGRYRSAMLQVRMYESTGGFVGSTRHPQRHPCQTTSLQQPFPGRDIISHICLSSRDVQQVLPVTNRVGSEPGRTISNTLPANPTPSSTCRASSYTHGSAT
ncbi:hypothetical protein H0G86_008515 [Trichoderma simmonsii]|uniref:Uncharacterized protein n=1 Tax=Trichoderma simmonsii TaxID=1491479 RepID=A0A8G0PM11_9HYPO|nr:hypothetical protein H0G86_008515 [Trichoderma simmonsii]